MIWSWGDIYKPWDFDRFKKQIKSLIIWSFLLTWENGFCRSVLIFHCKKEKAGWMSVSHSGPWEITFWDLLKCFQCPTGVRESFFPKLALSGGLPPAVMLQKEEMCRAVSLCPVKHGILGILSPRTNLSAGRGKLNVPAVMGYYSCPAVAPGMMWP